MPYARHRSTWLVAALMTWCVTASVAGAGDIMLRLTLMPHRDVWYVGEPIQLRVFFGNLSEETTLVNVSPAVLATAVFEVEYDGHMHRLVAPARTFAAPRSNMLGPMEETFVDLTLTGDPVPFGATFDHRYYGTLPAQPTTMTIRLLYQNVDTGARNVVPFWTGTLRSEPVTIQVAAR